MINESDVCNYSAFLCKTKTKQMASYLLSVCKVILSPAIRIVVVGGPSLSNSPLNYLNQAVMR